MKTTLYGIVACLFLASTAFAENWKTGSSMLQSQAKIGELETEVQLLQLQIERNDLESQLEKKEGERSRRSAPTNTREGDVSDAVVRSFPFEGYTVVETYSARGEGSLAAVIRGEEGGEVVIKTGETFSDWVVSEVSFGGAVFKDLHTGSRRVLGLSGS